MINIPALGPPLTLTEALVEFSTAQRAKVTAKIHGGGHNLRQSEVQALARQLRHV